jgi:hypothetical protein
VAHGQLVVWTRPDVAYAVHPTLAERINNLFALLDAEDV